MRPKGPRWQFDPPVNRRMVVQWVTPMLDRLCNWRKFNSAACQYKTEIWVKWIINLIGLLAVNAFGRCRGAVVSWPWHENEFPSLKLASAHTEYLLWKVADSSAETVDVKGVTVCNNGRTLSLKYGFVIGDANRLKPWPQTGALAGQ